MWRHVFRSHATHHDQDRLVIAPHHPDRSPGEERDSVRVADASGAADSPAKSEDVDQLAEQDDSEAELDENPAYRPGDPSLRHPYGD